MIPVILLAAAPVAIASKTPDLDFSYEWSAEAQAVPALARRFRVDAAKQKADALTVAREDRAGRRNAGTADWNGHMFSRAWTTGGQSARLLSLEGSTGFYSGGAHPNSGSAALLWDRKLFSEIKLSDVLAPGQSWTGAIRGAFCVLLDRERAEKREEKITRGPWPNNCPNLSELSVVPVDKDRDARFDHLRVIADNYVAGPYVEGGYQFDLPVTAAMLARLKPEYRASFEPQPPVQ